MRITVHYTGPEVDASGTRVAMHVKPSDTVRALKAAVTRELQLQANVKPCVDEQMPSRRVLHLAYAGAVLDDSWLLADLYIGYGATIRAYIEQVHDPILRISIAYCERTIAVTQAMRLREIHVAQLRSMVSRKTGLPVSMFRMLSARGLELFDGHSLDDYEVQVGDTIRVESWDGANDFLALCQRGFAKHALAELEREKEASVVRYLLRVALYMAAHFGHLELASATVKLGVSPSEGVGEHPFRDWHRGGPQHPDVARTPIHEASEFGTIAILRLFIHQDITHVLANDGNGLKPLNLALRNHQREAASLLIAKQWMRQEYETITISIQFINRLRKWANRSRERAFLKYGEQRSTFRPKRGAVVHIGARVGEQSFFVTGFTRDGLSSKPRALLKKPPLHNVHTEAAADAIPRRVAKTRLLRATGDEPSAAAESPAPAEIDAHSLRLLEHYFKSLASAYESNRPNAQLALPQPPLVRRHPNGRVELLAQCAQQPQEADTGRHVTLVAASGTRGEPIQSQSTGTSIRDAVNASRSSASVKQRSDANSRSLLATPSSETAGGRPSLPEEQRSFGSLDEPNTRLSFYNGSTARTGVRAASTSSAGHSVYKSRSLSESTCRSRDIRSSSKASAESNQREEAEELSLEVNAGPPQMIDRDTSAQVSTLNTTDTPKSTKVNSQLLHIRNTESCRLAKSSTPNSSSRILKHFRKGRSALGMGSSRHQKHVDNVDFPLPLKSNEDISRPIFIPLCNQPADRYPVDDCLTAFEMRSGKSLREFSLHSLSIAGRFQRRTWLQRVHAALFYTKREVIKARLASPANGDRAASEHFKSQRSEGEREAIAGGSDIDGDEFQQQPENESRTRSRKLA